MKIIILCKGPLDCAIPIINIAKTFNSVGINTVIICGNVISEIKLELEGRGIIIYSFGQIEPVARLYLIRMIEKIINWISFRIKASKVLSKETFDVLYISTADTAISLRGIYSKYKYIMHLRELYDQFPLYMKMLKNPAQRAYKVVVPEENRAYLYSYFFKLKNIPIVIPNKPFDHSRKTKMELSFLEIEIQNKIKNNNNILYQGHLDDERNLTNLIKASLLFPKYNLVLMGKDYGMVEIYKKINPNLIHIPFVRPPLHLNITSWGSIGIITYDLKSLNTIYCAPNKIWEYTGFNIPVLGNINPGLKYLIGNKKIGAIADFNNEEDIARGIEDIEENYLQYQVNAEALFDSFDNTTNIELLKLSTI